MRTNREKKTISAIEPYSAISSCSRSLIGGFALAEGDITLRHSSTQLVDSITTSPAFAAWDAPAGSHADTLAVMKFKRSILSVAVLVLASSACKSKPGSSNREGLPLAEPQTASQTTASVEVVEEVAGMSLSLWPAHWTAFRDEIRSFKAKDEGIARVIGDLNLASPWTAFAPIAADIGLKNLFSLPPIGLLSAEPITIEVLPAWIPFEQVALEAFQSVAAGTALTRSSPRFRVTIPTSKASAFADLVRTATKGQLQEAVKGQVFRSDGHALRISVLESSVVLDIAIIDDAKRSESEWAKVFGGPLTTPSPHAFQLEQGSAARLFISARGLSDLGASMGMTMVLGALESVNKDKIEAIFAEGTKEVLSAFLFVDPQASVASQVFIDFPTDSSGSQAAFRLSPTAVDAFGAGGLSASKPVSFSGLDWTTVVAAVEQSPVLAETKGLEAVSELFYEGGWSTGLYLFLGNAVQLASTLSSEEINRVLSELPLAALAPLGRLQLDARGLLVAAPMRSSTDRWKSLQLSSQSTDESAQKAERCMRVGWAKVRVALGAVYDSEPSSRASRLLQARDAANAQAQCAMQDPPIAARYQHMTELLTAMSSSH